MESNTTFIDSLVTSSPNTAWTLLFLAACFTGAKHLLGLLLSWRDYSVSNHTLEACRIRLEIEKLRYEIEDLKKNKGLEALDRVSADHLLAHLEARPELLERVSLIETPTVSASAMPLPTTTPPPLRAVFKPWSWVVSLNASYPLVTYGSLVVIMTTCSVVALAALLMAVAMVLATIFGTTTSPSRPDVAIPMAAVFLLLLGWMVTTMVRTYRHFMWIKAQVPMPR